MGKEIITIKGDREKWMEFAIAAKRNKVSIWEALEPKIDDYIKDKK